MTIQIAVINYSSHITSTHLATAIADLNSQINNEFHAAWGVSANLYIPSGTPASTDYQLILMDNYSQSGILGYHELSGFGTPIGYVFYENSLLNLTPWTVPASHEVLEMLIDPNCNLSVQTNYSPYQDQNGDQIWLFASEVCDPVQNALMSYNINTTVVSNFVYPSWFQSTWGPFETQFDYQSWLFEPFQVGDGGAIMVLEEGANEGWQELFGDIQSPGVKPIKGSPLPPVIAQFGPIIQNILSRRTRKLMDRKIWKRSVK